MNWLVLLDMLPVMLKKKFGFHSKHWFSTNFSLTLLTCRSNWVVSYIPLPPVFDHSTILSFATALWFVNYLVSGVGSRFLNWWGREQNPCDSGGGFWFKTSENHQRVQRDVVIYYIWRYKIISFTIKMLKLVYLSVIVNGKPCLCIFSCGLSSWLIDSDWL